MVQGTASSSRIGGVTATPARDKAPMEEASAPQDRPEQEMDGYRDALARIRANHRMMETGVEPVLEPHLSTEVRYLPPGDRRKFMPESERAG